MALLTTQNIIWTTANSTLIDTSIPAGSAVILDGVYFQMIQSVVTTNPSTFNFILNELYLPTSTNFNKFSINLPQGVGTYYNTATGYYPFGSRGLTFGPESTLTIQANNGSSTGSMHFVYYLYGDIL